MIDVYEVVKKLVGPIQPLGETNADNTRFENLKILTSLVDKLVYDISEVETDNKKSYEGSRKKAAEFAGKFLTGLGIEE